MQAILHWSVSHILLLFHGRNALTPFSCPCYGCPEVLASGRSYDASDDEDEEFQLTASLLPLTVL
ncbi:hypothetical protein M378DRAFT_162635, partial [Amanita muscaria Koide BX008]